MSLKQILAGAALLFLGYWLYSHRGSTAGSPGAGSAASGQAAAPSGPDAHDCLRRAEEANQKVHDALMTGLRPPVDPGTWSAAEGGALSAISSAESACGSGGGPGAEAAQTEIRGALSSMRSLVGDFSSALRGGGSVSDAPSRQGEIDEKLDRARGLLRR